MVKLGGVIDADGTVALAAGANTVTVEVTNGAFMRVYTVTVTRPLDTTLSGLSLSGAALSPAFDPETVSYSATVGTGVSSSAVTATVAASGATVVVKLGGVIDADGTVALASGANTVTVEVTNGAAFMRVYTVTVTRLATTVGLSGSAREALMTRFSFWDNRDWDWYRANIPFVETPDDRLDETYYYRWQLVTKHLRYGSPRVGYVATEFNHNAAAWAGSFGAITAPSGLQLYEMQWLRERRYVEDYLRAFFVSKFARPHSYSTWLADNAWSLLKVHRNDAYATGLLSELVKYYEHFEDLQFNSRLGLFWSAPIWDAMEHTVSTGRALRSFDGGDGYRPTLNSYMYANALAIERIADMAGDTATAARFRAKAAAVKTNLQNRLWDQDRNFFLHMYRHNEGDGVTAETLIDDSGLYTGDKKGREQVGFIPWAFNLPDDLAGAGYEAAWQYFTDTSYFKADYGPTTAEQSDHRYQVSTTCCRWRGRSWPFATSQSLKAMANVLQNYTQTQIDEDDYVEALNTYVDVHMHGRANAGGGETPFIAEANNPDTGSWAGHDRTAEGYPGASAHYFHSGFVDLVITGLLGLQPQPGDALVLKPLVPDTWDYFILDNLRYHGRDITVIWDRDGTKYDRGTGFQVFVGDASVYHSATVPATATIDVGVPVAVARDTLMNYAANNTGATYPQATASNSHLPTDPPSEATNGKYFYTSDPTDRWTSYNAGTSATEDTFSVDFGQDRPIHTVKLYLFDDGGGVQVPSSYAIQYWNGTAWAAVTETSRNPASPTASRANVVEFTQVSTSRIRAVLTRNGTTAVGMTEFEAWGPAVDIADPVRGENLALNVDGWKYPRIYPSFDFHLDLVSQVNDGSQSTHWSTGSNRGGSRNGANEFLRVDFDTETTFDTVVVEFRDAADSVTLEYLSGGSWVAIPGVRMTPATPADNTVTTATFPAVTAREVRVNFTTAATLSPTTGYTTAPISVNELEIYDLSLTGLTIDHSTPQTTAGLEPAFDPATLTYAAAVPPAATAFTVTAQRSSTAGPDPTIEIWTPPTADAEGVWTTDSDGTIDFPTTNNTIRVRALVTTTDNTATKTYTIDVRRQSSDDAANTAPVFAADTASRSVAENTAEDTNIGEAVTATDLDASDVLEYSISAGTGADAAADLAAFNEDFAINAASGQVTVKAGAVIDFESRAAYVVSYQVSDNKDAAGDADTVIDDTMVLTINVGNVDEAGTVTLTPPTAQVGAQIEAALSDLDGTPTGIVWQWARSTDPTTNPISWVDIGSATSNAYTPTGVDSGQLLRATASYSDPQGANKSASAATVSGTNTVPEFATDTATREIAENTAADTNIGDAVTATDPDTGDSLVYQLSGTDQASTDQTSFVIDAATGQLKTKAALDYETKKVYSVVVTATDESAADDTITVTINVGDVNEKPEFAADTATREIAENTAADTNIGDAVTATDPDTGDSLVYQLSGTDQASFVIDAATGQLKTKAALDYETKQVYSVVVSVSDNKNPAGDADEAVDDTVTVTINVGNVDEAGTVTLTPPTAQVGAQIEAALSDLDGTPTGIVWQWARSTDPTTNPISWVDIGSATSNAYTPTGVDSGQLLRATASYSDPQGANKSASAATVSGTNTVPEFATDTATREIAENTAADTNIGDAVTATDPDTGDSLVYQLSGTDQASTDQTSFVIDAATGQLKTKAALDYETKKVYSVVVTATDESAADDTITVTINVGDVNEKPEFATDTATREIAENTAADTNIGDAVTATDPDTGDSLVYQLSGTDQASFVIDAATGQLKTKAALDYETKQVYSVVVSVSDNKDPAGDADEAVDDTVTVTINVGNVDEAGTVTLTPPTAQVGAQIEAALSDLDGTPTGIVWQWARSTDPTTNPISWVDIGSATSNAYTPTSVDSGQLLRATASYSDPQGANKSASAATASGTNTVPEFATDTATREIAENTAADTNIGDAVTATDPDTGDSLVYQLSGTDQASTDQTSFVIDAATGQLKTKAALDYETKKVYSVVVTATDESAADDTITVTINVGDVNEKPEFATDTATREIAENTAADTNIGDAVTATDPDTGDSLVYQLSGTDQASFVIDAATGQLKTKAALDYETKQVYSVVVSVSDNKDPAGDADEAVDDTVTVTINVGNVDEAGTVTLTPPTAQVGAQIEAALSDLDGTPTGIVWQWARSTDPTTNPISWVDIGSATSNAYTPTSVDSGQLLRATASYSDPQGANKSASAATASGTNTVPEFATDTATREIAENTAADTNIGDAVTATDPDTGDSLVYQLSGTDQASTDQTSFVIDAATGQLKTKAALDYETKKVYSVVVTATDESAADDTITVTINVGDVNEKPEFATDTATREIAENTAADTNIGDAVTATDPDTGDSLVYQLSGTDQASFVIDAATGQLKTKAALDYETKQVYSVVVSVSDNKDPAGDADEAVDDTVTVTINVGNVDEAGTVTLTPPTAQVGAQIEAALSDLDGTPTGIVWQWARSTDPTTNPISWVDIGSATSNAYTPTSVDSGQLLRATASYSDPQGANKSASAATASGTNTVPEFATDTATREIAENTAADTNIGDAVTATDPDTGDSLVYQLSGTDQASTDQTSFVIDAATGQLKTKAALDYETKKVYSVVVTATDESAADDTITVTINVGDVNEKPEFATDTATREIAENTAADTNIGDAVTATDPDTGDSLVYQLSGTDQASFVIDAATGQLKTKAALDYETKQVYSVVVSVSDNKDPAGDADEAVDDTVTVTINVGNVDEAGTVTLTPPTAQVGAQIEAALSDLDGTPTGIVWQWARSTDPTTNPISWVDIGSATSNAYTPTSVDSGQLLRATASYSDPQGANKSASAATASGTNTVPEFATDTATREIAENTAADTNIGDAVTATDPDTGDSLVYQLSGTDQASTDQTSFVIDAATGQLKTKAALDYETKKVYSVVVTATDESAADDTITVTINVGDVNEKPEFATDTATREIAENTAADTNIGDAVTATDPDTGDSLVYQLSGTDQASFVIDAATGQLKTKAALDYETKQVYSVVVSVSDNKDPAGDADEAVDDTVTVTINVGNVDEAGTVTLTPPTAQVGAQIEAALSDLDGTPTGIVWQWARSTDPTTNPISWVDIGSATSNAYTPTSVDSGQLLRATASYSDPQGANKSASAATASGTNTVPEFATDTATREIAENTAADTNIGDAVTATDPDTGDSLVYQLSGTDQASTDQTSFVIDAATGQLKTKAALDYETKKVYSVVVTATDESAADDTITVTINVGDVNEKPEFATDTATREIAENTAADTNIGDAVTATDPDTGDSLVYQLSGTDQASFVIDAATGQLKTKAALDYETKQVYSVVVSVSDNKDPAGDADEAVDDTVTVTINVGNVDEAGTVTLTPPTAQVGAQIEAALSDLDGTPTGIVWQWARSTDPTTNPISWVDIGSATIGV